MHLVSAARGTEQTQREREVCALGKRDHALSAAVSIFRCIIFVFATSRIHKKHVQLGHAGTCRGNKHINSNRSRIHAQCASSYMKSILGGPWLLGALGSRLPLPNG